MFFILLEVLGFLTNMFEGFVLMKGWNWHVVPALHVPVLTYWPSVAIVVLVGWITFQMPTMTWADMHAVGKRGETEKHETVGKQLVLILLSLQALAFLYVIHLIN